MARNNTNKSSLLNKRASFSYLQIAIFALIFGTLGIFAVLQSSAAPTKSTNKVWIIPVSGANANNLKYNDNFKVGFTLAKQNDHPTAYAECFANRTTILGTPNQPVKPENPIWSGYRSLDGTYGDTFNLNDPIQHYWIGGGADCTLSTVLLSGTYSGGTYSKITTLSSIKFIVSP